MLRRYLFEHCLALGGKSLKDERRRFGQLAASAVCVCHFLQGVVIKLLHDSVIRADGQQLTFRVVHFVKTLGKKSRGQRTLQSININIYSETFEAYNNCKILHVSL